MERKRDDRKLKEILEPMSRKEKISYLWGYYKWVPLVVLLVIAVLCSVVRILAERSNQPVLSGIIVNLPVTEEGGNFLTEDLLHKLGDPEEKQYMDLQSIFFSDLLTSNDPSADQATAMKVTAKVTVRSLDYVMMDEVGFSYYKNQDVFSPLDTVLTPQQMEQYADYMVYHEGYALALDLTDTAFVQSCVPVNGRVYLSFPGNTGNNDLCIAFAEEILQWQTAG